MILGTGLDIVAIARMESWLKDSSLLERYFSREEIEYALARGAGAGASLAARFAAKEAFGKALGTGLGGLKLKDIEVRSDHRGCPRLELRGTAREASAALGKGKVFLSLTHEASFAAAQVIIEEADNGS